ncbi:Pyrimidine 5'-nucleotidase YjjG [compost metagenome]
MIKGILFDLDGTLLDRDKSLVAFLEHQYDRFPPFQCIPQKSFVQRFIELDQKGYVWKDKVYQILIQELNIDLDWEILLQDYVETFRDHCIGFPGLIEMLDELKGMDLKLGIISNGFGRFQMNNIKGLNIEHYFDEIFVSEYEGLRKPDVEIFRRALDRLGIEPQESIFVRDHPVNDVEASARAGMKAIWKEEPFFEGPSGDGDYLTIRDLRDIKRSISLFNGL